MVTPKFGRGFSQARERVARLRGLSGVPKLAVRQGDGQQIRLNSEADG